MATEAKTATKKHIAADYAHRRPKMLRQTETPTIDPHREHYYYGITTTSITKHLNCKPPSHAYDPSVKEAQPSSHHRRSSAITQTVLGSRVKRITPDQESWFNRQCTDVTQQLRMVPPAHATDPTKPDPWYGRMRTYVTNPLVDDYSVYQAKEKSKPPHKEEISLACPNSNEVPSQVKCSSYNPACSASKVEEVRPTSCNDSIAPNKE